MSKPKPFDALGDVPGSVAPSQPVRYWHRAVLAGAFVFGLAYVGSMGVAWLIPNPDGSLIRFADALKGGLVTAYHFLTVGISARAPAREFIELVSYHHPVATWSRIGVSLLLAAGLGLRVFLKATEPVSNTWHLSGPRLLEGKEAVDEARHRSVTPKDAEADPFALSLHPDLLLSKKHWARHVLITGSVGSGKSVILKHILEQLTRKRDAKLFLYDIKGDFTSIFKRPIIVSPFDARSHVWDVAADVRTPTQAAAFAASLIPEGDGNAKFWSMAAQDLLIGCVRELQNTRPGEWEWPDLAASVRRPAAEMAAGMRPHYPRGAALVRDPESQTTSSVLSSLGGFTRLIDDLATAWPKVGKRRFSMTEWIRDDYNGRKQVIVQSGPDPTLTKAYIAAMINVAVPDLIGPGLPDDEGGRGLYFVFDELTSAGRLNIDPLLALGRSKGVVAIMAVQDHSQVELVYGDKTAQAFSSLVGTHVVCQVQMGATRDKLASQLGKRKIAWRGHENKAQVHEESRALVSSGELTDRLGFRKGNRYGPEKWGIEAIVQMGGDVLLLTWPGKSHPTVREGQVAAAWTTKPAGPEGPSPATSPSNAGASAFPTTAEGIDAVQRVLTMTPEEVDALFSR
ncbi:helicase HerA-like domain-containing protein [Stenotrophomonas maltophilia]|uniref:helicase HerA-like domain-containing protein n=1 Tax=Stenotrophomonas maltophilia TaxID=40324 RepID=UPI0013D943EB|nr:helicase HerA-like domain-containing protein [Stenotrophomonas maltophilia]MBN4977757.1 DUF853 family protein [Stenotrophomonas maltophilia]NRP01156.1 DUF853 family protein [Stenotrophomonas maltophilia]